MKFKTTSYHFDLLKDNDRVSAFFEAINDYEGNNNLAYDLGCGIGVLSYFLKDHFGEVTSLEIDKKAYCCAKENLKSFDNVEVVNEDVLKYNFTKKADLIVCEMLDTALIDEEEIPVLNYAKQFLKEDGKIIPQGIINTAELVNLERHYVHWDEEVNYEVYSKPIVYSEFNFLNEINPEFGAYLTLKTDKSGIINGLKITSYTKLNDKLIVGPSPMLNPPLLIPLDEKSVNVNDLINVKLKYIMGNGIESIRTEYY
ncbi:MULTISPECIES: methyltransferase domain-containing protein [Methanobrevibacter]|uniref:Putative RNA methylase n=1 Tax=Methanobrevibacter gottschalkii DSM 11977 TaxID=1122229 RepID=A0A3N5BKN4_9EURY|nr:MULTISPECIES: methyltransferase domain-containing protein [Methanobrevibacter]OED01045.1 SAM-dependent methyltransferase [Methanobrevibacter sp. A27]RPF50238.1 putative RNA methylase [Methanobrevibacter gottschalkii DSM 11977]